MRKTRRRRQKDEIQNGKVQYEMRKTRRRRQKDEVQNGKVQ